jgi:hypothetical protein
MTRSRRRWNCRRSLHHDRKLPDKAIDVIDEAGAASGCCRPIQAQEDHWRASDIEAVVAKIARIPPKQVSKRRCRGAPIAGDRRSSVWSWPGRGHRSAVCLDQAGPGRPARAEQADRLLPVRRPDRCRQDRSGQTARLHRWASNCCASTCRNTWSGTPSPA